MRKAEIIEFFDSRAENWDAEMIKDESVVNLILDKAGIAAGTDVLDVACGTGVLIPDYLSRGVSSVTAIDIAPEMIRRAAAKFTESNLHFICGDVEETDFGMLFDCIMVYNAFPHFPEPERLVERLSSLLKPDGRLTIAHGMSREAIDKCHQGPAGHISMGLMHEDKLAAIFENYLCLEWKISDDKMYIVTGRK